MKKDDLRNKLLQHLTNCEKNSKAFESYKKICYGTGITAELYQSCFESLWNTETVLYCY